MESSSLLVNDFDYTRRNVKSDGGMNHHGTMDERMTLVRVERPTRFSAIPTSMLATYPKLGPPTTLPNLKINSEIPNI
jgi:hypothetical protein